MFHRKIGARLLPAIIALLPLQACATTLSSEPIQGQVLEEGTNKPIPGAIIVVLWKGTIGHGRTTCYHVETTTTNDEGRYQTQAWKKPSPYGDIANRHWTAVAYKAGYEELRIQPRGYARYLRPFTGTRAERLEYLSLRVISASSCGSSGESYKNLYLLRYAVYEEAAAVAQAVEEKRRSQTFKDIANETLVDRASPQNTTTVVAL